VYYGPVFSVRKKKKRETLGASEGRGGGGAGTSEEKKKLREKGKKPILKLLKCRKKRGKETGESRRHKKGKRANQIVWGGGEKR